LRLITGEFVPLWKELLCKGHSTYFQGPAKPRLRSIGNDRTTGFVIPKDGNLIITGRVKRWMKGKQKKGVELVVVKERYATQHGEEKKVTS